VEIVELPDHPYFLGCQFHPEFKSKPLEPHPLFLSFIHASYEHRTKRLAEASPDERNQYLRPEGAGKH
jgi:CTP synthase